MHTGHYVQLDEQRLVDLVRNGDQAAFEELWRRYQETAYRVAFNQTRSNADALDVTQRAAMRAYMARASLRSGALFGPWLLRIVHNEACNHNRSEAVRGRVPFRMAQELRVSPMSSPEDQVVAAEGRRTLYAHVLSLPRAYRQVVVHRFWIGLSVEETAAALGWETGTVKSRTWRALRLLRDRLRKPGDV